MSAPVMNLATPPLYGPRSGLKPALQLAFACFVYFVVTFAVPAQQPSPRLIPFQGRLTDQQGRAYTNSQYSLTFRLYNQAVGGTEVWTETHRKVGVINGMVNVFLGSINSLEGQDFSTVKHLGIRVDADDNPVTADPEMVPRQMIIPAFWAKQADNSTLLAGTNWSAILVSGNNPASGFIRGDRLQSAGITTDRIAPDAITSGLLAPGAVQTSDIGDGQITVEKLSPSFQLDTVIPPGTIQAFGGPNVPLGWLLCDGSAFPSNSHPRLFEAIGIAWGAGYTNGLKVPATDFNVPDLRGVFLRGVSGAVTNDPDREIRSVSNTGGNPGNLVGSIQPSQTGQHTHGGNTGTDNGNLTAQVFVNTDGNVGLRSRPTTTWSTTAPRGNGTVLNTGDSGTRGAVVVGQTSINNTQTTESRPNNAYVHYIIKY